MTAHLIVDNGFGRMVHRHPFTGEAWTPESANDWQRKCASSPRSGGIHVDIRDCDCEEPA